MKSFLLNFRVPAALLAALEKNVPKKEFSAFSRLAVAEKLARDFGEQLDASALAVRVGQGRRTDLERLRERIAAAEKTLAPYGGAAKVISTGEGAEACETALDSLTLAQRKLIDSFPRSRKLRERAEKAFAGARARLSALADARRECEAAEAEFESALERGERADYRRAAAARERVERLSAQRETLLEKFLTLRAEALRVALDCAGRAAGVPAPKPRRGSGDNTAGK